MMITGYRWYDLATDSGMEIKMVKILMIGVGPPELRCSNSKEQPGAGEVAELPASRTTRTTSSAGYMSAAASWRARLRREDWGLAFQCLD